MLSSVVNGYGQVCARPTILGTGSCPNQITPNLCSWQSWENICMCRSISPDCLQMYSIHIWNEVRIIEAFPSHPSSFFLAIPCENWWFTWDVSKRRTFKGMFLLSKLQRTLAPKDTPCFGRHAPRRFKLCSLGRGGHGSTGCEGDLKRCQRGGMWYGVDLRHDTWDDSEIWN